MSPRSRKTLLVAHVVVSVGWLGAATAMMTLALRGLVSTDPIVRVSAYETMHYFDLPVNAPLSISMLITGILCSVLTPWGLIRHWWVLAKLVLSAGLLLAIPFLSAHRLRELTETIPAATEPAGTAAEVLAISITGVTVLTAVTVLSVFKPWGRTRWY
ncbi:hypothetical protein AD006_30090 (plasmid) [Pseudonocardia sp. EC080610-09]|nr:hypothetical protein AD006_30090 [Pseudonocardia sp. EC080610-09]ALL85779.1 hypothetical protein AD017_31160 [Pseudonocardia sp. EC080619-01]